MPINLTETAANQVKKFRQEHQLGMTCSSG